MQRVHATLSRPFSFCSLLFYATFGRDLAAPLYSDSGVNGDVASWLDSGTDLDTIFLLQMEAKVARSTNKVVFVPNCTADHCPELNFTGVFIPKCTRALEAPNRIGEIFTVRFNSTSCAAQFGDRKPVFFMHVHNAAGTWLATVARKHQEKPLTGIYGHTRNLNLIGDRKCEYDETYAYRSLNRRVKRRVHETLGYINMRKVNRRVNRQINRTQDEDVKCSVKAHMVKKEHSTFTAIERPFLLESDWCPDDFLYVTIVREPIALMRSTLLNDLFDVEEVFALKKGAVPEMTKSDYLFEGGYQHFDNFLTRSLNGREVYRLPYGHITRKHLDNAKQMLSKFDLVIDLNHLDIEMPRLFKMLHWDASVTSEETNVHDSTFEWTMEQEKILREANWADLELYEYATNKVSSNS